MRIRLFVVAMVLSGMAAVGVQAQAQAQAQSGMTQREVEEFRRGALPADTKGLTPPAPVRQVKPTYTPAAMREKIEGTVEVELVIGVDGRVARARLVGSIDNLFGLDESALAAAKAWVFKPGTLDGRAVPVLTRLHLEFRLH